MASFDVTITVDTRWSLCFARAACALRYLIGRALASRLAAWGAFRLARWRIGDGRWRRGLPIGKER